MTLQLRRGGRQQVASYTGKPNELIINNIEQRVALQDGLTAGGRQTIPLVQGVVPQALMPLWGKPDRPILGSPVNGSTIVPNVQFTSSALVQQGGDNRWLSSEFEVATTSDFGKTIVCSSGEIHATAQWSQVQPPNKTLYARVRHRSADGWSEWSSPTVFHTTDATGFVEWTEPGSYLWGGPPNKSSKISVVVLGAGGHTLSVSEAGTSLSAGAGGGLAYATIDGATLQYPVTVTVGAGGTLKFPTGGTSSFSNLVSATGGNVIGTGGNPVGTSQGGAGGSAGVLGGGGAGGYAGSGGAGTSSLADAGGAATPNSGAGAGGSPNQTGGGTGLHGITSTGDTRGSAGSNGSIGVWSGVAPSGAGGTSTAPAGNGAVRIIWGYTYPQGEINNAG